ncbi:MAG: hypothetical protein FWD68_17745 [Alphaproteobacteria bacterium]|nr:hypothetical protein [Alphaproteobacteria bacterium]
MFTSNSGNSKVESPVHQAGPDISGCNSEVLFEQRDNLIGSENPLLPKSLAIQLMSFNRDTDAGSDAALPPDPDAPVLLQQERPMTEIPAAGFSLMCANQPKECTGNNSSCYPG